MLLKDQAHEVAVALAKGENMRTTAGVKFAEMVAYVHTPGTDGAQQVIEAGYEPTDVGCWKMITSDHAYPITLGISWSTGRRQLRIGKSPNPAKADQEDREDKATYDASRRHTTDMRHGSNVTVADLWEAEEERKVAPAIPVAERAHVKEFLAAWHDLTPEEQAFAHPQLKPVRF